MNTGTEGDKEITISDLMEMGFVHTYSSSHEGIYIYNLHSGGLTFQWQTFCPDEISISEHGERTGVSIKIKGPEHLMAIIQAIVSPSSLSTKEGEGWIRVESEQPEADKYVLLYNGYWIGVGKRREPREDDVEEPEYSDETSEYIEPKPSHWRLLPPPPVL